MLDMDIDELGVHEETKKNKLNELDKNKENYNEYNSFAKIKEKEINEFDDDSLNIDKYDELGDGLINSNKEYDDFNDNFINAIRDDKIKLGDDSSSEKKGHDEFDEGFTNSNEEYDEFDEGFTNSNEEYDEFGDFDDFEEHDEKNNQKIPTEVDIFMETLEKKPEEIPSFVQHYLNRLFSQDANCSFTEKKEKANDILNTSCSSDLWDKLSRDMVFHNPVTGAVGSFQWTKSEANKAYLNALGVTFITDEKTSAITRNQQHHLSKKRHSKNSEGTSNSSPISSTLSNTLKTHVRSSSVTGSLSIVTSKDEEKETVKYVDQDLELDIDIAKAYCELTKETIRIFPNVKLNAMVIELTRLQKQAAEYLEHVLDQKEQLAMDSETYNDLISCIVGHAQRLREQNPSKDASPAMVSKKKRSTIHKK